MSLERITLIARRIPAVLDKKFNGELEGSHINNIALALKCNGAMKEPGYRRSADREATMLAALNKAVELGLVTIHPTRYGFTCISATSAHTPRSKVIDLSTPSLFRHCTSPYQDEMAHYAA